MYMIILGRLCSKPVSFIFSKKITLKLEVYNFVIKIALLPMPYYQSSDGADLLFIGGLVLENR